VQRIILPYKVNIQNSHIRLEEYYSFSDVNNVGYLITLWKSTLKLKTSLNSQDLSISNIFEFFRFMEFKLKKNCFFAF